MNEVFTKVKDNYILKLFCISEIYRKAVAYILIVSISFFSVFGCSSTQQTQHMPIQRVVYAFAGSQKRVYQTAIATAQRYGYVIAVSDPNTGLLTAEHYTTAPIPEDAQEPQKPSAGEVFLTILGIVLIVGLVFIIIDSASSDTSSTQKKSNSEHSSSHSAPDVVTSYKYVMNLSFHPMGSDSTNVECGITKIIVSNGTPTSSHAINAQDFVQSFLNGVRSDLKLSH